MSTDIEQAIRMICEEKGLSYETVMEAIESALAAAYRKDYGNKMQNIEVEFDTASGAVKAFDVKTVVEDIPEEELEAAEAKRAEARAENEAREERGEELIDLELEDFGPEFNPKTEIMLADASVLKMGGAEVGDVIRTELPVAADFGRMAAMTAKQVVTQKLREAEREIIFNDYKEHEGTVVIGTVQRREGRVILVDLGRSTGVILPEDQMRNEQYRSGDRLKVFIREVSLGNRGAQILLSRSANELIEELFEIEIPEVGEGIVEIKKIAREAGGRTKIAVSSNDESVDPIGACIGQRGSRIQTIINELSGEKIDIIEWSEDDEEFITAALAPAEIQSIVLTEEEDDRVADVLVADDQLSLAIGRGGQNVRLASQLSGWRINVRGDGTGVEETEDEATSDSGHPELDSGSSDQEIPDQVRNDDDGAGEAESAETPEPENDTVPAEAENADEEASKEVEADASEESEDAPADTEEAEESSDEAIKETEEDKE
jgi:N utilization substance protein A